MQILVALFKEKHFILETCFTSVRWELKFKVVWFKVSQSGMGLDLGFVLWNKEVCVRSEIFSLDHGAEIQGLVSDLLLQFSLLSGRTVVYEIPF